MTDRDKRTASEAYHENWMAIQDQLQKLQTGLRAHKEEQKAEPNHWGFVGDLGTVLGLIQQAAQFINGEEE